MDNDLISRSAFEQALLKRPRATMHRDNVIALLAAAPAVDEIERLQAEYELLIKMYAKVCEEKCVLQAEIDDFVTHWQPLPEPPKEGEQ